MYRVLGPVLAAIASLALLSIATAADSSCTAHSADEGTPRTCSITCGKGKQAVCEEGVAGGPPQCRCADKSSGEAAPGDEDQDESVTPG